MHSATQAVLTAIDDWVKAHAPEFLVEDYQPNQLNHIGVVAFSGGLDSTVLLHGLCQYFGLQDALSNGAPSLLAVHVNHHLQAAAKQWPAHCEAVCAELGVSFRLLDVEVNSAGAQSIEAAARTARYRALATLAIEQQHRFIFCAHHKDDQLETVLLQLFRGQGWRGLAGMPACGGLPVKLQHELGLGSSELDVQLARPFLGLSRSQLEDYARLHGLAWVNDPTNDATQFARNALRHQMVPLLNQHFPAWQHGVMRLAHWVQHQALHNQTETQQGLQALVVHRNGVRLLSVSVLRQMSRPQQLDALRAWLNQHGVQTSAGQLQELLRQLTDCQTGGKRQVAGGWSVTIKRGFAQVVLATQS